MNKKTQSNIICQYIKSVPLYVWKFLWLVLAGIILILMMMYIDDFFLFYSFLCFLAVVNIAVLSLIRERKH